METVDVMQDPLMFPAESEPNVFSDIAEPDESAAEVLYELEAQTLRLDNSEALALALFVECFIATQFSWTGFSSKGKVTKPAGRRRIWWGLGWCNHRIRRATTIHCPPWSIRPRLVLLRSFQQFDHGWFVIIHFSRRLTSNRLQKVCANEDRFTFRRCGVAR